MVLTRTASQQGTFLTGKDAKPILLPTAGLWWGWEWGLLSQVSLFYFVCVCVCALHVCMYVCAPHMCLVPVEAGKQHQNPLELEL